MDEIRGKKKKAIKSAERKRNGTRGKTTKKNPKGSSSIAVDKIRGNKKKEKKSADIDEK